MRAREGLPSLRSDRLLFEAMRGSLAASEKDDFRVLHFSIQSNHLHLIVEADDERTLSRGCGQGEALSSNPACPQAGASRAPGLLAALGHPSRGALGLALHLLDQGERVLF